MYRFCDGLFSSGRYGHGGIFMIGLIIVLVILFVLYKKGVFGVSSRHSESALDSLQKRYVNDEISQDEYLAKKEILKRKK